jgi:hypothetical protein
MLQWRVEYNYITRACSISKLSCAEPFADAVNNLKNDPNVHTYLFYNTRIPLPQYVPSLQYRNQGSFQQTKPSPGNPNPNARSGLNGTGSINQRPPLAKSSATRPPEIINQQKTNTKFAVRLSHLGVPPRGSLGNMLVLNTCSAKIAMPCKAKNKKGPETG